MMEGRTEDNIMHFRVRPPRRSRRRGEEEGRDTYFIIICQKQVPDVVLQLKAAAARKVRNLAEYTLLQDTPAVYSLALAGVGA